MFKIRWLGEGVSKVQSLCWLFYFDGTPYVCNINLKKFQTYGNGKLNRKLGIYIKSIPISTFIDAIGLTCLECVFILNDNQQVKYKYNKTNTVDSFTFVNQYQIS